jgi:LPXTG-motif cell wall-anchored protein
VIAPAFSLALAALFGWAFYTRYWIWRDCFNELGRCYDPISETVLLEQSGIIWGGLAAIALGAAVILWRRRR